MSTGKETIYNGKSNLLFLTADDFKNENAIETIKKIRNAGDGLIGLKAGKEIFEDAKSEHVRRGNPECVVRHFQYQIKIY